MELNSWEQEKDLFIVFKEDSGKDYIVFDKQNIILLIDKTQLLGVYIALYSLFSEGFYYKKQKELASILGLSPDTYATYREQLVKLGVITALVNGKNLVIKFNRLTKLPKFSLPKKAEDQISYIKEQKKLIRPLTEGDIKKQTQLILEGMVDEKAKEKAEEIIKNKTKRKRKVEKTYPKEDYKLVLEQYTKITGIGFIGQDYSRACGEVKSMFESGHKPKEIIDCFTFFEKNKEVEGNSWLLNWRLSTVMKSMAAFKAGKIILKKKMEDTFEKITND